jgi:hypothetical protein
VPSLRVVSIALLVALGATAAGLAGPGRDPAPATQLLGGQADPSSGTRIENRLPGTRGWRIAAAAGVAPGLDAYAGAVSVRPGEPVALHLRASGRVTVRALRIGWYGGAGARQVWAGDLPAASAAPAIRAGAATTAGAAATAAPAGWPVSARVGTAGWPPGHYLLRLDSGAASRYVPLTLRSPSAAGRLVLVTSPLTWQAANPAGAGAVQGRSRSFDRPYSRGYGAGSFLLTEAPIIQLAERDGDRLAYATDLDVAQNPALLARAAGVSFGSASQYWPPALRTSVTAAIAAGTNAAFFGDGTGARPIELAAGGRAVTVLPAADAGPDPGCGDTGAAASTSSAAQKGWTVLAPQWWGYGGTAVSAGQPLPGLAGEPEGGPDAVPDAVQDAGQGVTVLAGPPACAQGAPAGQGRPDQGAAYWTSASGAAVFSAGTVRWACAAGGTCPDPRGVPVRTRAVAAGVTRAVLAAFSNQRAGAAAPAA